MTDESRTNDLLRRARQGRAGRLAGWTKAVGRGEAFGVSAAYTLATGDDACAVRADGVVGMGWGHTGRTGWHQDSTGMVRAAEAAEVAMMRMIGAVMAGRWAEAGAPAKITGVEAGDDAASRVLTIDPGECASPAKLTVDAISAEPRALVCQRPFGIERWRFAEFDRGRPRQIDQILPGNVTNSIHLEHVSAEAGEAAALCVAPPTRVNWTWDERANAEISVERVASGFVLIEPVINGHRPGAFVFDTGAAVTVISREAAERCELVPIGSSFSSYTTGSVAATRWKGSRFDLGPLGCHDPWFTEMDMALLTKVTGRPIAGVVGYDVLARAVVEFHIAKPRMVLRPRGSSLDLDWRPLSLYSNRPHLTARFATPSGDAGEGLFRLDSGAPRLGAIFNAPTVARYALNESAGMAPLELPLPGGTVDATMGPIAWIELAGRRVENVRGLCVIGRGTGFDDAACGGNLGQDVLGDLRLVFDYANRRAVTDCHRGSCGRCAGAS